MLVVLAVAGGLVAWRFLGPNRQSDEVTMPPDAASARAVVSAYLHVLDAHDCDTARALWEEASRSQAEDWCADVGDLADIEVDAPFTEGSEDAREVSNVPVEFRLSWRAFHDDGTMPEGPTSWGYRLRRTSAAAPWRIFDQGMG